MGLWQVFASEPADLPSTVCATFGKGEIWGILIQDSKKKDFGLVDTLWASRKINSFKEQSSKRQQMHFNVSSWTLDFTGVWINGTLGLLFNQVH